MGPDAGIADSPRRGRLTAPPMVSAVMPTANRRQFVPQAIDCFLSQTYEHKELWIADDGEDPVVDLIPDDERIHYAGFAGRMTIPEKRNLVNSLTAGSVIIHWDDDDWSAPERMESQVLQLEESRKNLIGYHALAFWDVRTSTAYWYGGVAHHYICGTSMCYRREFWDHNPFDESKPVASDNWFCRAARIRNDLWSCDGGQMMVARLHDGRTNSHDHSLGNRQFKEIGLDKLHEGFRCRQAA